MSGKQRTLFFSALLARVLGVSDSCLNTLNSWRDIIVASVLLSLWGYRAARSRQRLQQTVTANLLKKRIEEKKIALQSATASHDIDVCIFIDPLYDFLSEEGAFCMTYGKEDTENILQLRKTLNDLLLACDQNSDIHVVMVTSVYQPKQFATKYDLCTTEEGCSFALEATEKVISRNKDRIFVLQKYSNSILSCSEESRQHLLNEVTGKTVMIAGVTSTACVNHAVSDLLPYCRCIVICKDAIACRKSAIDREVDIIKAWESKSCINGSGGTSCKTVITDIPAISIILNK